MVLVFVMYVDMTGSCKLMWKGSVVDLDCGDVGIVRVLGEAYM